MSPLEGDDLKIIRTYKFRLYAKPEQAERLNTWCAAIRAVYNAALEQRLMCGRVNYTKRLDGEPVRDHAKEEAYVARRRGEIDRKRNELLAKTTIKKRIEEGRIDPTNLGGVVSAAGSDPFDRDTRFSAIRQNREVGTRKLNGDRELELITDAPADSFTYALRDLDKAFQNFFDGRARFPSWRNAVENNSFTVPGFKVGKTFRRGWHMNVVFGKGSVRLPKIGRIRYAKHKKLKGKIKTVTVIREGKHWYICANAQIEIKDPKPTFKPAVGVDVGVAYPLALSSGEALPPDQGLVKLDKRKRRLQRELSRRDRQSSRRRRSREKIAKIARHIAARRKARLHQVTTDLVRNYGVIGIEDLRVQNMTRSARGDADDPGRNVRAKAGLNCELLNVAPFSFRMQLDYKAEAAGVQVIAVDPRHTSQTCNACGVVDPASRKSQSEFRCVDCGHVANANVNAAQNILTAAVAGRRKAPSDPYPGQPETGTATLNPTVSPLWTRIAPHFSSGRTPKSGGTPDAYP